MGGEKKQGLSEGEVIERLENMNLLDVPPHLTPQIMQRIEEQSEGGLSRFFSAVSQPFTISFRPLHACAIVLLIVSAFALGRVTHEGGEQSWVAQTPPPEEWFDAGDAHAAYLIGRGLLEADRGKQALRLLQRAAALAPGNPEYAYWEGIGYWSTGNRLEERNSYIRGLAAQPDSIPLLTNLGHSLLADGQYEKALDTYQAILALDPSQPTARYNSGLIQRLLDRTDEEIESWKGFLESNRTGRWAFRAIGHLNNYGDFSFRTYVVGARNIILSPSRLFDEGLPAEQRQAELAGVAEMLDRNSELEIEVVVFAENDLQLARDRALTVRNILGRITESNTDGRIGVSWFDSPESVRTIHGSTEISTGLLLFNRHAVKKREEISL